MHTISGQLQVSTCMVQLLSIELMLHNQPIEGNSDPSFLSHTREWFYPHILHRTTQNQLIITYN